MEENRDGPTVLWRAKTDEARTNMRQLLDSVEHEGAKVLIDRYKRPSVVMVNIEWYWRAQEALGETWDWPEGRS